MRLIKTIFQFLTGLLFLLTFVSCNLGKNGATVSYSIFISPQGNDANKGSKDNPFKTLDKAKDVIRKSNGKINTVYLRAGTYNLSTSFILEKEDSGSKESPVVYKAYENEKVSISGGIQIPLSQIKDIKDHTIIKRLLPHIAQNVVVIDLKELNIGQYGDFGPRGFNRPYIAAPNELFINGKALDIARWPNKGEEAIPIGEILFKGSIPRNGDYANKGAVFKWNTSRPKRWLNAQDVYITGLFNYGYAGDAIKLKEINQENETFTTLQPHLYGFENKHPWNNWVALNVLEEIDVPGEYFIDKKNEKVYFYPPKEQPLTTIQLSVIEQPLVQLINASHIIFDGITFECSRGMGVYIEGGNGCLITNSVFKNLGLVAVNIGMGVEPDTKMQHEFTGKPISGAIGSLYSHLYKNPTFNRNAGSNHGITNCEIYNMGAGGIILGGGNRITLEPGNNYVKNCQIYNFNRLDKTYKSGINIDGVGNKIQNCIIRDAPGTAIYLHGNDHIIEYNEVHHVMMDGDDQGAFYLGRDPSEFNNIVRYNYFHHIGISPTAHSTFCLYYDDGSCGNQAYGNVFYKAGNHSTIIIGGGKYNKIFNNVFIDCNRGIQTGDRLKHWSKALLDKGGLFEERLNLVKYNQGIYAKKYPELANYWEDSPADPSNAIYNNVFVHTKELINKRIEKTSFSNNWETDADPGFVDMKNQQFGFKKDAKVFDTIPDFKNIPFEKMGLYHKL
ncbi:right-handed parallel beta-helix repeat-containing protein [Hwangdonia sp.]|uniref:right-handed parallel beta-helix repeat-containing protein n=1 Tax=Hwangdonia sp. TaxID=1883432 RepID=UPI003AB3BD46